MWEVAEAAGEPVEAIVVLDKSKYGLGFPKGKPGQVSSGYIFYQASNKGNKQIVEKLTVEIGELPILYAVTETQYSAWNNGKIFAKPATFSWY